MQEQQTRKQKKIKILWWGFIFRILILLFLFFISYAGFVAYKIFTLEKKILVTHEADQHQGSSTQEIVQIVKSVTGINRPTLSGEESERINILLLGMGGEGHKGKYLTDTIILVSINPKTYESAMLSIPRDLYAEISDSKVYTKINAIYAYGKKNKNDSDNDAFQDLKSTVQNITGQRVHYYMALDFEGFKNIIQEVGGIDVEVKEDIYDSRYPGPNYSYETFEIDKGFHHLDPDTALKYARVRHTKGGDFGRAARQQQVIAATKRKAFSLGTISNPYKINNIINQLGDHLKTDIELVEIPSFVHLAKNINIYQTTTEVLDAWDKDSLLASTHVDLGGVQAYILKPRAKSYSQIHELANNIFYLDELQKKRDHIEKEDAAIVYALPKNVNQYEVRSAIKKIGLEGYFTTIKEVPSCNQDNKVVSLIDPPKIYTLNDLAEKLDCNVEYSIENVDENKYDIAVCFSDEMISYFVDQDQQQNQSREFSENSIVDEAGNVLTNN